MGPNNSEFIEFLGFQSQNPGFHYAYSFDQRMFAKLQQFYKSKIFHNFDYGHICVIKGEVDLEFNHLGIKCFSHFFMGNKRTSILREIHANHIKSSKDMLFFEKVTLPEHSFQLFVLIMGKDH